MSESSTATQSPAAPLRVLYLTPAFPKPATPEFTPWGLRQAKSLRKNGVELLVVSFRFWAPRFLGRLGFKHATLLCPPEHDWGGVRTLYPRWLYPQRGGDANFIYNHPAPFLSLGWASARGTLDRIIASFRPDIIHAHQTTPSGWIAAKVFERHGIPFVLTDHSSKQIPHYTSRPPRRAVGRYVQSLAGRWVALSSLIESDMKAALPEARTVIVPNGTDEPAPEILAAKRPAELADKLIISCVAGFYPVKNLPTMVRAFAAIANKHPKAIIRLCGDGETRPQIEEAIRETGMQDRITLVGAVPHDRVLREMATADVFVLPSLHDTYPTVCLEAAAVGCAQIWPLQSGISDKLKDNVHGFGVDTRSQDALSDAMDRILSDPDRRAQMRSACRRLFEEELAWDVQTPRLISVYREVIAEAREQRRTTPRAR